MGADTEEQPKFETVTVYVPDVETVSDCVFAPAYQVFPVADEEVRVTEPPAQKVVGPLVVIVGTGGSGFTVTVVAADIDEHGPFETVTV
jgi:hypothetical protein